MNDILVLAADLDFRGAAMNYAVALAAQLQGTLGGLYVLPPAPASYDFAPAGLASEVIEIFRGQVDTAACAGNSFAAWAAQRRVASSSWHCAEGSMREALAAAALWHDVIVLERNAEWPWPQLGQVLLGVDVPCLIVPQQYGEFRLRTVAVAWDGSPHAARAVHAALPLLRRAARILLIDGSHIEPTSERVPADPTDNMRGYLANLGVETTRIRIAPSAANAGVEILAAASGAAADLLVMGAYGRTRFSEWIFGGATRHLLEQAAMPLFMRH